MQRHYNSLTLNTARVLSLLEDESPGEVYKFSLAISEKLYREELRALIHKNQGLHFGARTATLEQMEQFCLEDLSSLMQGTCPGLWHLLTILLDAEGRRWNADEAAREGEGADEEGSSDEEEISGGEFLDSDLENEHESNREDGQNSGNEVVDVVMLEPDQREVESEVEPVACKPRRRRTQDRVARDRALLSIKCVVVVSILGQSSNERFNSLQSFVGFFLESKQTPEIVLEVAAHMGVSVATQSVRNMLNSLSIAAKRRLLSLPKTLNSIHDNFDMDFNVAEPTVENRRDHWSATAATFVDYRNVDRERDTRFVQELHLTSQHNKSIPLDRRSTVIRPPTFEDILPQRQVPGATIKDAMAWHIRAILVEQDSRFAVFKTQLGQPKAVEQLSYTTKDISFPACVIDADEGSTDGNWDVLQDLYRQRNVPDSTHEEYLTFIHGDLATKERIDGLQKSRRLEKTAKNRLDNIIFIGLFHVLMAAANAVWRLHILPSTDRQEDLGLFNYINILRPKSTNEFTAKNGPSYHSMHDIIHHALWADVLNMWRVEVKRQSAHDNLGSWAESRPSWETLVTWSVEMVDRYIPDWKLSQTRRQNTQQRDMVFESLSLRLQHLILYVELCRSVKYGDVGRILELFSWWIPIFSATGKHKYVAQLTRFITDLRHRYPPPLRDAVLRNWLFNSTGKPDGWQAYDWLQEENNLYTKVIFAGQGPNRTKKLVIKRSVLLPIYKSVQRTVEESFYLTQRAVRHSKPTMTQTLRRLGDMLEKLGAHTVKLGRTSSTTGSQHKWEIKDAVTDGLGLLSESKALFESANAMDTTDDLGTEVSGNDVGTVL
ncbi:hypothetical protein PQX77_003230 [Marasmius sp. AFHP31]|nr:hypothetical protein PQX77_003230 [Marasmius sp. AFHP31]